MTSQLEPPTGGDVDIGYQLTAVVLVTFTLAAIAVTLRMYARLKIVRKVGLDDWLILFAVVCFKFSCSKILVDCVNGNCSCSALLLRSQSLSASTMEAWEDMRSI